MALSHLLDTSVYSQALRPRPVEYAVRRWRLLGDRALAVSIICEAEVRYGLELKGSAKLSARYRNFLKGRLHVFAIDDAVAQRFATMKATQRRTGRLVSDFDLLIAATARTHQLILATLDESHFSLVEDLTYELWT